MWRLLQIPQLVTIFPYQSLILHCVQILEYHVVPNVALYAANFTDGEVVKTIISDTFTVWSWLLPITNAAE